VALPKAVFDLARELLVLPGEGQRRDLWLWEHARRVAHLAPLLALLPEAREIGGDPPDQTAVTLAALFADAGWAVQIKRGELGHWHVLSRPTNDIQRELGIGALQDGAAALLPPETVAIAVRAIRECNDRYTKSPEARVLSEAENLDDIGIMFVLRQFRHYQIEGQPLDQLMVTWTRYREYHYWDARINDCLRWETTRHIARSRLEVVERFMLALSRDRDAVDLHHALQSAGIDTSATSATPG
jgi:HD superfamily phosphodiesterase